MRSDYDRQIDLLIVFLYRQQELAPEGSQRLWVRSNPHLTVDTASPLGWNSSKQINFANVAEICLGRDGKSFVPSCTRGYFPLTSKCDSSSPGPNRYYCVYGEWWLVTVDWRDNAYWEPVHGNRLLLSVDLIKTGTAKY